MRTYVLDAHRQPVPIDNALVWGEWFETANRTVAFDKIGDDIEVSTVFLGLDHRMHGKGPPILFETMVFRKGAGDVTERYSSWSDAEAGHAALVNRIKREVQNVR